MPRFAVFVRQANGVAQEGGGEPEQYWPYAPGPIDSAMLAGQTDRAISELAGYAEAVKRKQSGALPQECR